MIHKLISMGNLLESAKKQIPMKLREAKADDGWPLYFCGRCDGQTFHGRTYCHWCGQRLDWE